MHSESGDNDDDDDESVRERWDDSDRDSSLSSQWMKYSAYMLMNDQKQYICYSPCNK